MLSVSIRSLYSVDYCTWHKREEVLPRSKLFLFHQLLPPVWSWLSLISLQNWHANHIMMLPSLSQNRFGIYRFLYLHFLFNLHYQKLLCCSVQGGSLCSSGSSAVCCFAESMHQTAIVCLSSEVCVGEERHCRGSSLRNFSECAAWIPFVFPHSGDERDACSCLMHLNHTVRTGNCICKCSSEVPGKARRSPRVTKAFPGRLGMRVRTCVGGRMVLSWMEDSLLLSVCLSRMVCGAHRRCTWQKLGKTANFLGGTWEGRAS